METGSCPCSPLLPAATEEIPLCCFSPLQGGGGELLLLLALMNEHLKLEVSCNSIITSCLSHDLSCMQGICAPVMNEDLKLELSCSYTLLS